MRVGKHLVKVEVNRQAVGVWGGGYFVIGFIVMLVRACIWDSAHPRITRPVPLDVIMPVTIPCA